MLHVESSAFDNDWWVLKGFLQRAPKGFQLKAARHLLIPPISTDGSVTNSDQDVFDVYVRVALEDYGKLADGVEYQIVPPDEQAGVTGRSGSR